MRGGAEPTTAYCPTFGHGVAGSLTSRLRTRSGCSPLDGSGHFRYPMRNVFGAERYALDIQFRKRSLRDACSSESALRRRFGDLAGTLALRLQLLFAAPNLEQVPRTKPIRCHQLDGKRKGQFAVDLKHPHRLVFRPNHDSVPLNQGGGIDRNAVTAIEIIEIIEIIDYH